MLVVGGPTSPSPTVRGWGWVWPTPTTEQPPRAGCFEGGISPWVRLLVLVVVVMAFGPSSHRYWDQARYSDGMPSGPGPKRLKGMTETPVTQFCRSLALYGFFPTFLMCFSDDYNTYFLRPFFWR